MYDEDGRLIESRPEPEWDDAEREWMLALEDVRRKEEAERCHLCGMPRKVCRARGTERALTVESERCHVTTAVARARSAAIRDGMPDLEGIDWIPAWRDLSDALLLLSAPDTTGAESETEVR